MLRFGNILRAVALDKALGECEAVWSINWNGHPTTHNLEFLRKTKNAVPMFNILSFDGTVINPQLEPKLAKEKAVKIMENMVKINVIDQVLLGAQRQGRISFYMACLGEEAETSGSIAALSDKDTLFMQYREAACCLYRGYGVKEMISQCMGNKEDPLKGRQMPIHYGSKDLNMQVISSPLATQIPHAAGAGFAFKLEKSDRIACCYFGDGAASEGDFHAGINFASVKGSHTLFFCRNNGFAISTPCHSQYNGDGIVQRGIGYGIPSIRVDGSDVLAVYAATEKAREIILKENTPVLIETIAYRCGDHSTSDDSSAYREKKEIQHMEKQFSPIDRFGKYLSAKGWWNLDHEAKLRDETLKLVQSELARQESLPLWPVEEMFNDTYHDMPSNLARQKKETLEHYNRNKEYYDHLH